MVHMTDEQLRQLQMIELEMLEEVDRICKKYDIKYSLAYGTMLGAVRHKGFIPWDDDVDVQFLRPEYERFRKVVRKELDRSRFYFQDERATKGYRWEYGKIRRKNTLFLREFQEHMPYKQGVFIDLFPFDGVADDYFVRAIETFEAFIVRKVFYSKVGQFAERNPVKREIYKLLAKIPEEEAKKYYHGMVRRSYRHKNSRLVRTFGEKNFGCVYGYMRSWFENTRDIEFEGKVFTGVEDYKSYLSMFYGDYMKIPPEGERKTHPVSRLKL